MTTGKVCIKRWQNWSQGQPSASVSWKQIRSEMVPTDKLKPNNVLCAVVYAELIDIMPNINTRGRSFLIGMVCGAHWLVSLSL